MTRRMALSPFIWLLAGFNLFLAGVQILLLVPLVSGERSLDFPPFHADALGLAFGVMWTLGLGLGLPAAGARLLSWEIALALLVFSLSLLAIAYAREPVVLLVGWEIAGLAVWFSLRELGWAGNITRCAILIHAPGLLLLAAILLGPVGSFVPPQGGEAIPWPLFVSILFGVVALLRAGCGFFLERAILTATGLPIVALYSLAAPFLLAKALVAAPWDDFGVWALALMGTVTFLVSILTLLLGAKSRVGVVSACAAIAVAGLELAPLSPLAAGGAVALLLGGTLWIVASSEIHRRALLLLATLPGLWLLSQGSLDARYRLVAAILLPAFLFLAYRAAGDSEQLTVKARVLPIAAACLVVLAAIYPQAVAEWIIRPVVGAMAGGVGVPSTLITNWGLGLRIQSPQERVLAALPATGIALGVFLAWVALYWLRGLARLTTDDRRLTTDDRRPTADDRRPTTDDGTSASSGLEGGKAT